MFLAIVPAVIDNSTAFYDGLAVPATVGEISGLQSKGRLHVNTRKEPPLCFFLSLHLLFLCNFSEQRGYNDRLQRTKMMIREQESEKVPKDHSMENMEGCKMTVLKASKRDSTFGDRNSETKTKKIRSPLLLMSLAAQGCF